MNDREPNSQVLLLDDDEDDYVLLKAMLREAFGDSVHLDWYQKDHVANGMICSGIYNVSLVDYLLGKENGIDVIRKVKAECPDQTLFLYTGFQHNPILERAIEAGADGYIIKAELSIQKLEEILNPYL